MTYQIDQSGRIEFTGHKTVVAYANSKNGAVLITAGEKRKLQRVFRQAGKPNMFVYKTFATLIYLLIKTNLKQISTIVIDKEYYGREDLIKKLLVELIRHGGDQFEPGEIHFSLIGKRSNAHKKAISVFRQNEPPNKIVTCQEILEWVV